MKFVYLGCMIFLKNIKLCKIYYFVAKKISNKTKGFISDFVASATIR